MAAKGHPKWGGRKKGSINKIGATVKESVWNSFLELQKDEKSNLTVWAKNNLRDFYVIAAKLIPTEMNVGATAEVLIKISKK